MLTEELKNKLSKYEEEQKVYPPKLIKLNSNENLIGMVIYETETTITVRDPVYAAFSFYTDTTQLSIMRFSNFSAERDVTISKNNIMAQLPVSEEVNFMYTRARAYVYDVNNDYLKKYITKYGEGLQESLEKFEEYANNEDVAVSIVPSTEDQSVPEEAKEKLWEKFLKNYDVKDKKAN